MSEHSLNDLIHSLKTEAIEAAEKESERILNEAREKAQQILKSAEIKRDNLLEDAERESVRIIEKGEAALRQAGRDYIISVRNEILHIFQTVFEAEVQRAFTPELMKEMIIKVTENIGSEAEITMSSNNTKELADYIHDRLKSSDLSVSIIEDNAVLSGFIISRNQEGWSFTVSPEEVSEALKNLLNKNWREMLDKDENLSNNKS
jgi:vacuolar-type H+-ATPase subunit E/Vma4